MGEVGSPLLPQPIAQIHDCTQFSCRHESLTFWLQRRAMANAVANATRTYVVCEGTDKVIGYYALAAGSLLLDAVPGRLRRNMPDPLPVILLARLAVDARWEGRSIGSGLLKDAVLRSLRASAIVGARALLAHAIDETSARFYRRFDFVDSPTQQNTLLLPLH